MKRILSLTLTIVMLAVLLFPVQGFALDNKELENAITKAKTLLEIGSEYDVFTYGMTKNDERTIYNLSWRDSKGKLGEVNVNIDSTGKVWSYYAYTPYYGSSSRTKLPTVSKSEALATALNFIAKVNPQVSRKIKYQTNNSPMNIYDTSYYFTFFRQENYVAFPENNVSISVDNKTGKVMNYSCTWTDGLTFPDTAGIMSMENAQQAFKEKLGLKPVYRLYYDGKEQKPYLAYVLVYNNSAIDAKTGEVIHINNYYYGYMKSENTADQGAGVPSPVALTPEEVKAIENMSNFVSETKAEEIARTALKLDDSYNLNSINLYNSWMNKSDYTWSMNFTKAEENGEKGINYYNASVSVDAISGEILNFYKYSGYDPDKEIVYDEAQSQKIAEDFIKSMQPEKSNSIEKTDWNYNEIIAKYGTEKPRYYYFTFTRKLNDVYFPDNGFSVTVDTTDGTITQYNLNWYNGELPKSDNMITSDAAHKVLFDNIGLQLQYITDYSNTDGKILPQPDYNGKPDIKLVYTIKQDKPVNIDALTGTLLDYSGKPYVQNTIPAYNDIKGTDVENKVNLLALYGISLPGSEFKPTQDITQRDFMYLLVKALDPYFGYQISDTSDYDEALYNYLVSNGIVKEEEKAPESTVSRQDAAKFIVKALRYDNIAGISKGIFALPFTDKDLVSKELCGYVALAYGLDILEDYDGYFKPTDNITRAGTINTIYNLLK